MLRRFEHLVSGFRLRTLGTDLGRVSYYDLVLAVIPLVFLVAAAVGEAMAVSSQTTVTAASLVAALAVVDALFLNPPGADD